MIPELHWFVITNEDGLILSAHGPYWHDERGAVDFSSWSAAMRSAGEAVEEAPGLTSRGMISQFKPVVGMSLRDPITEENVLKLLTPEAGELEKPPKSLYMLVRQFGCRKDPGPLLDVLESMMDRRVISEVRDEGGMRRFVLDPAGQQIQKALTLGYVDVV